MHTVKLGLGIAVAAAAALVALATVDVLPAGDRPQPTRADPDPRVWPAELVWPSERSFKADQIEALDYAPEVVFFGGSRSMRFEPAYLARATGLLGFNLAMTNGKPEDAWAFLRFLHERSPATRLRWIWGVQLSTLYTRDLEAGLLQDPRLNRSFPDELLWQQRALLPAVPEDVPESSRAKVRRYGDDGVLLWNSYDAAERRGRTLARSLEVYGKRALEKLSAEKAGGVAARGRSREYFEKSVALLNGWGVEPVIVCMPVHPEVLGLLREHGWQRRHERFLEYLSALRGRLRFAVLDLTEISSFDGDPSAFYDGVHIKRENAQRMIDVIVRDAASQLE
jgi:hypothetical protein